MRIAIDASRAARPELTGTEIYSLYLLRTLLARPARHDYVLYFNQPPAPGLLPRASTAETRVVPLRRLWTHVRLAAALAADRPDLLFVPSHTLPIHLPVPAVVTVHDVGYRRFPQAHRRLERVYLELSTRQSVRAAARVVTVSETTKTDLVNCYNVDPAKVDVTPLAARPGFVPASSGEVERVRVRYGLSRPYLLYVGTLQPRKNLSRLVRAFTAVRSHGHQSHQLVLAGRPSWDYPSLVALSRQVGVEGEIVFPGYVTDADLPALMSGCAAFVLPSLYEGFGLPVLEAMACGAPVLCSNTSALPEVAGNAALTFDPVVEAELEAAIRQIVSDARLRAELSERGLQRAAEFSWERTTALTLRTLEAAVANRGEP